MATLSQISQGLAQAKAQAESIASKVGTLAQAEKAGLSVGSQTTVQQAQQFLGSKAHDPFPGQPGYNSLSGTRAGQTAIPQVAAPQPIEEQQPVEQETIKPVAAPLPISNIAPTQTTPAQYAGGGLTDPLPGQAGYHTLSGTPSFDATRFQTGFQAAKDAGIQTPDTLEGVAQVIGQYTPPVEKPDQMQNFISADPFLGSVVLAFQQYMGEQNQRVSLIEEYKSLLKESGVQELDTELLNMKQVIEGTEDDIRNEVLKAGGFATDSQVLALTNSRNKQLIKNYNALLETRNTKEKYLDTMLNLTAQDRQEANQRFETMMNFGFKIADYKQKMQTNAVASLDRIVKAVDWDGLWNAAQGDPYTQGLIEKTYGFPSGGFRQAALRAGEERAFEMQERELGLEVKREQILTEQAQRAEIYNEISGKTTQDPVEILAFAQQYASTGMIPTGMPKGTFGFVSQAGKALPKPAGTFVDTITGVKSSRISSTQEDAMSSLYDITKKIGILNTEWEKVSSGKLQAGITGGLIGKVFGAREQTNYLATRKEIVDLLARARTGAVITKEEEEFYSSMLPGRFTKPLGIFGASGKDKINKFEQNMNSILDSKAKALGVSIYGYSKVNVGGQDYTVGDIVQNEDGITGRILPDGSVFYSE